MQFSPETLRAIAPDEETLNRAIKISDVNKWSDAACSDKLAWGAISGSSVEDYFVMLCVEPLDFSCDCPVKIQPCKHSLALFNLYLTSELSKAEIPDKVAFWAQKRLKTQDSLSSIAADDLKIATKEKRNNERLELMRAGVEDLEKWLYDLYAQGLANLSYSNQAFWENSAARFKDSKLGRVAFTVREIADELSCRATDYKDIAIKIAELSLMVQAFKNIDRLENQQQEELLNQLGRLVRKSDVIENNNSIKDIWTVCGCNEQFNLDGLLERKVWLHGEKNGQNALILDFLFQGDFELKFNIGDTFESELYFYPGTVLQRALINATEISLLESHVQFHSFKNFNEFLNSFAKKLKMNPWLNFDQGIIENLRPVVIADKAYLCDQNRSYMPICNLSANKLFKLLAISGTDVLTLSLEYSNRGVQLLGWVRGNSICAF
jgi:hypothetical protein